MTLTEYANKISDLTANNKDDPEIYSTLQPMIEMFLRRKKVCNCSRDYSDLSYVIAGDLFMSISNENLVISNILGYLEKIYRKYAHTYYNEHSGLNQVSFEDVSGKDLHEFGRYNYQSDVDEIINKTYLLNIKSIVDDVLVSSCKYDICSKAYHNLKLSLVLSILRGQEVCFHLTKEQEFYLKLIYTNFHNKVVKDGIDMNEGI